MTIDMLIALLIIGVGICLSLASIYFLVRGLRKEEMLHIVLAGNVFIMASTMTIMCYVML